MISKHNRDALVDDMDIIPVKEGLKVALSFFGTVRDMTASERRLSRKSQRAVIQGTSSCREGGR